MPLSATLEEAAPGWTCTAFKDGVLLVDLYGVGIRLSEMEARALLRTLPILAIEADIRALIEVFACHFTH